MSDNDCKTKVFKAPIAGYYFVASKITKAIPTGKNVLKPNPDYSWWKFWVPKMIEQPEYRFEEVYEGREIRYLNKDETVACQAYWIGN